mgnify:FL=1
MNYDPTIPGMRIALAASLQARLEECGFFQLNTSDKHARYGGHELVFTRKVNDNTDIRVYTTISGGRARGRGLYRSRW